MYRLYIWLRGAPKDRPGGPWWYHDFKDYKEMHSFFKAMKPFLCQAYLLSPPRFLPEHDPMNIEPPAECSLMFMEGP